MYATDCADTRQNRAALTEFAQDARIFFCEAAFAREHSVQALRTGHLTTEACAAIAAAAEVGLLVPFHFSRRYEQEPERIYEEVLARWPRTLVPGPRGRSGYR